MRWIALALALGLKYPPEIQARYNIAPTQQVPIVRLNKDLNDSR
jgi:putative SOS response-associated peptidase YedK